MTVAFGNLSLTGLTVDLSFMLIGSGSSMLGHLLPPWRKKGDA